MIFMKHQRSPVSLLIFMTIVGGYLTMVSYGPIAAQAAESLVPPKNQVILTISGKISVTNTADGAQFDRDMLEALGTTEIKTWTPWTEGITTFEGVLAHDVLNAVGAYGSSVRANAINDYEVIVPVSDFEKYGVILATKKNGTYMRVRDKGPLWIIYPLDDFPHLKETAIYERSIWQLNKLTVE